MAFPILIRVISNGAKSISITLCSRFKERNIHEMKCEGSTSCSHLTFIKQKLDSLPCHLTLKSDRHADNWFRQQLGGTLCCYVLKRRSEGMSNGNLTRDQHSNTF